MAKSYHLKPFLLNPCSVIDSHQQFWSNSLKPSRSTLAALTPVCHFDSWTVKNIYICSRPCLDLLSQNIFRSSCPPSFRDIFLHRLIKEEQHQLNFRLYVKNVMYSKKLSVLSEEYFISANNLNSCFTLMLLLCYYFLLAGYQVKNFKTTPRIVSALCVCRHSQVSFAFDVSA